jgi:hypothetical protein
MVMNGIRRNVGGPAGLPGSYPEQQWTSLEGEEAVMSFGRDSDTLIVVKKQGNTCGAKGCALLCKGLMAHLPGAELE